MHDLSAGHEAGPSRVDDQIARAAAGLCPGWHVVDVRTLAADEATAGEDTAGDTHKTAGYGAPRRVRLADGDGHERSLVFHLATANDFGHDRRADRAAEQLLAFDTFARIPRHVRALDVGALGPRGLVSLGDVGELYLVSEWADGTPYADDLRRLARTATLTPLDRARCDVLADYLVELHGRGAGGTPAQYRRALRDLVGSGEGIFGIRDAYGDDTPGAPGARLDAIEARCLAWRARLKRRTARATTIHGDFHPFNIVFADGVDFNLLDASRGCVGDAADDVAALAINFVFFALDREQAWRDAFAPMWHRFFDRYLAGSGDDGLCDVIAPFLAWRGLVVACPAFYPSLPAASRDRVLSLVERALAASRFDPALADEVMR
jgi:aminoglycoside phosphotransferase (APT) family kinase protein